MKYPTRLGILLSLTLAGAWGAASPAAAQTCNGLACTIVGTSGDNTLNGTTGADVICGLGGNDTIIADAGADTVCGGAGTDTIFGDAGTDTLFGENGFDSINGGPGADTINGGADSDTAVFSVAISADPVREPATGNPRTTPATSPEGGVSIEPAA